MTNESNTATIVNHSWENCLSTLALAIPLSFCLPSATADMVVQPLPKEIVQSFSADSTTRIITGEDMTKNYISYISTLTSFVETILCGSKDLPMDFAQILEENFMDMLVTE
jgi:hypothetical protein